MAKYLLRRLLHGALSIIAVVAIVMLLVYTLMDRTLIFAADPTYSHMAHNQKTVYQYSRWKSYGYLDYVSYNDYLNSLVASGELSEEARAEVGAIGFKASDDPAEVAAYVAKFTEVYKAKGYKVVRLDAQLLSGTVIVVAGGQQQLFAYKDEPLPVRLWNYFTGLIRIDNIHYVKDDVGKRGLTFTLYDPINTVKDESGKVVSRKFSPAIIGNGTRYKYLFYTDSQFPFIHQNLITINLGTSYTVNNGVDVFTTMNAKQGAFVRSVVTFPTGLREETATDLHSATYATAGARYSLPLYAERFSDDYINTSTVKGSPSKVGYSFGIGIIAVIGAYLLGVPIGIVMARKKDKLVDKLGTIYIVFIIAVPSLAYIFLFKAIGGKFGLPTTFRMDSASKLMYVLPIISLALPSVAGLMNWIRRYMIDQMNSDYVKFARSGGLSEREIFNKHILKNAIIPIVHGIPGSVLGALTGAIITERVYVVPGAGNLLTEAINKYDNGVIVGVTLFYAVLSVISVILGDILMSLVDPRISFSSKAR